MTTVESNPSPDEAAQIQRLGAGAAIGGLVLLGTIAVVSPVIVASVLITLGLLSILGEWVISRSYTLGLGIAILGIFPLLTEFIVVGFPIDLRFVGGVAVVAGALVYVLGPRLNRR